MNAEHLFIDVSQKYVVLVKYRVNQTTQEVWARYPLPLFLISAGYTTRLEKLVVVSRTLKAHQMICTSFCDRLINYGIDEKSIARFMFTVVIEWL